MLSRKQDKNLGFASNQRGSVQAMKNIKDLLFYVGAASLLLLTAAKEAGAQCVLAPPGTGASGAILPADHPGFSD